MPLIHPTKKILFVSRMILAGNPKILALCGSTRAFSANEKILRHIALQWQAEADFEVYTSLDSLPHFNPDLADHATPDVVVEFRKKIESASGVLFCTPEYVFSPPAVVKNALEWLVAVTVLMDKPTALIVAAGTGEKTLESLTLILSTLGVSWSEDTRLLIQGARSKLDAQNNFTDETAARQVDHLMKSFLSSLHRPLK